MRGKLSCLTRISTLGVSARDWRAFDPSVFSQSTGIEINTHFDATIGRARECLNDGPVRQNIGRKIDFMLCAIDQFNGEGNFEGSWNQEPSSSVC
jgi:hypothetical protein